MTGDFTVRVRGRLGRVENDLNPEINGKWVFTVGIGAIGDDPDVERTYGFFSTEAQAKVELDALVAKITRDAKERIQELTGKPAEEVLLQ